MEFDRYSRDARELQTLNFFCREGEGNLPIISSRKAKERKESQRLLVSA